MSEKRKVGRPREGDEVKRAPLSCRTSDRLRTRIEASADESGRSLAQEVELRLEQSMDQDERFGGAHNREFFGMAVGVIAQIERRDGKRWIDDHETYWAAKAAMMKLMELNIPRQPENTPFSAAIAAEREARDALIGLEEEHGAVRGSYAAALLEMRDGDEEHALMRNDELPADLRDKIAARELIRAEQREAYERWLRADAELREFVMPHAEAQRGAIAIGAESAEEWFKLRGPKLKA